MNNLLLNWRFGAHHLQILRFSDWPYRLRGMVNPHTGISWYSSPVSISYNAYHADKAMTWERCLQWSAWCDWFKRY